MTEIKKIKLLSCADLRKWVIEEYIPFYEQSTNPQAAGDSGGNPDTPIPPKPPTKP